MKKIIALLFFFTLFVNGYSQYIPFYVVQDTSTKFQRQIDVGTVIHVTATNKMYVTKVKIGVMNTYSVGWLLSSSSRYSEYPPAGLYALSASVNPRLDSIHTISASGLTWPDTLTKVQTTVPFNLNLKRLYIHDFTARKAPASYERNIFVGRLAGNRTMGTSDTTTNIYYVYPNGGWNVGVGDSALFKNTTGGG